MYSKRPSIIVGFHGCDQEVRDMIVSNCTEMKPSENEYDWLGNGFYFWENNYKRALLFAKQQQERGKIKTPAVLGAYIDLGNCLDLLDSLYLDRLKETYARLKISFKLNELNLPKNTSPQNNGDLLLRKLDCAVIQSHVNNSPFQIDSVRGAFWEGDDLYPGAGMKEKNHIQICIRNIDCIKCFFIPRELQNYQKKSIFATAE